MALTKIALDTNVAIEVLNNNEKTISTLKQFESIYLPITVCGELLYGAKNSAKVNFNLPRFQSFIADCQILDTVEPVAVEYSDIKRHLKESGLPIPKNDIWIAAICNVCDLPLFTRDSHFKNIPSLKILS